MESNNGPLQTDDDDKG